MTKEEKNRLSAVDEAYRYNLKRLSEKYGMSLKTQRVFSLIIGLVTGYLLSIIL